MGKVTALTKGAWRRQGGGEKTEGGCWGEEEEGEEEWEGRREEGGRREGGERRERGRGRRREGGEREGRRREGGEREEGWREGGGRKGGREGRKEGEEGESKQSQSSSALKELPFIVCTTPECGLIQNENSLISLTIVRWLTAEVEEMSKEETVLVEGFKLR